MPYKDKAKQKEFARSWIASRRADFFKGKICVDCGSDQRLELDHLDPSQKESHRIWSWAKERREAEIAKCTIRCRKCHQLRHAAERIRHGRTRYQHGCRCDVCKQAMTAAIGRWKTNRSGQVLREHAGLITR